MLNNTIYALIRITLAQQTVLNKFNKKHKQLINLYNYLAVTRLNPLQMYSYTNDIREM
jgi:hypothetical protein